jgi:hypothetical protein
MAAAAPRPSASRPVPPSTPSELPHGVDLAMTNRILEEIGGYEDATRASLISFLSSDFAKEELEKTCDWLQSAGYLTVGPALLRSGRMIHTLSLSAKGKMFLSAHQEER